MIALTITQLPAAISSLRGHAQKINVADTVASRVASRSSKMLSIEGPQCRRKAQNVKQHQGSNFSLNFSFQLIIVMENGLIEVRKVK